MAYSELVKRFDLVRDYMRDFLIFGFKTREDFDRKSGRTYDNERRRIESWLGDSLRWEYRAGGKALFLSLDAGTLSRNPLYRAWQSKSFTDNDSCTFFCSISWRTAGPGTRKRSPTSCSRHTIRFLSPSPSAGS